MFEKEITNKNIKVTLNFDMTISCPNCSTDNIVTINDEISETCSRCSYEYSPQDVLQYIHDNLPDQYDTKIHNNRSLSVKNEDISGMFWGTGVMAFTGKDILTDEIITFSNNVFQSISENANVVESTRITNYVLVYNLDIGFELRELYQIARESNIFDEVIENSEKDNIHNVRVSYNDVTFDIYTSGKIVARNNKIYETDTLVMKMLDFIKQNTKNVQSVNKTKIRRF